MKGFYGLLLFLSICPVVSNQAHAQQDNFDTRILRNIEEHRTDGKTSFYKIVSGSTIPFCVAIPATYLLTGIIGHHKDLTKQALYITESIVISQVISFATKAIVNRERPAEHDPTLIALRNAKSGSFPSGHTSIAFATATSLAFISHKWYIIVPAFGWASLVGYSRLYLGVHYPTDVIAGAILGSGSAWLSFKLNKWMHKSKKEKLKKTPGL